MKIENVKDFPCVEIEWEDADADLSADASVSDLDSFAGDEALVQDIGYLISYNEKTFILATGRFLNDNVIRHRHTIPTALVRKIYFLETKKWMTKEKLLLQQAASSSATPKKTKPRG